MAPENYQGVQAYLSYGAHIDGWIDNAYGVASDAFYTGTTDRFRGVWNSRPETVEATDTISITDHSALRSRLIDGQRIVALVDDHYQLAMTSNPPYKPIE